MRIDSQKIVAAGNNSRISDLVNRLDKGDIIRAKVLETSPDEVVLRLSDGTVLKAATVNDTGFRAGEMVTLSVKARTESQILLEIVTELSPDIKSGSSKLQKLLEALGIEPDKTNMELASELLKYKTELRADDMARALELMKNSDVMDPEKAAFITAKKIDLSRFDTEKLARFLDGEMKLGQMLDSLANALDRMANIKSAENAAHARSDTAAASVVDISNGEEVSSHAGHISIALDPSLQNTGIAGNTAEDGVSGQNAEVSGKTGSLDNTGLSEQKILSEQKVLSGQENLSEKTGISANAAMPDSAVMNEAAESSAENGLSAAAAENDADTSGASSVTSSGLTNMNGSLSNLSESSPHVSGNENATDESGLNDPGVTVFSGKSAALASLSIETRENDSSSAEKSGAGTNGKEDAITAEKLKDSINEMFIRISRKLSADDISTGKMKEKLVKILTDAEVLVNSPHAAIPNNAENAAGTVSLLGETVRMMDLLNSFNILYWQLPVNLGGDRGTAELYVMKRKQGRKRIDPNDTTIFLSLDTQNMGRVESLLDVKGNVISMDLRTESQSVSDFIRSNITGLYSGISECGYKLVNVNYSIISEPAVPTEQEKLLLSKAIHSHAKIDYRI